MLYFIDSADPNEIELAAKTGLVDGVTTNPSLVAKTGLKFSELLRRICETIKGPVSAEVNAMDVDGMLREAEPLIAIGPQITIKLPLTTEGLITCQKLTKQNVKTNVTLCFQPLQALSAAKSGATFISPFIGRLDDIGQNGMDLIKDIKTIFTNYQFKTKILAASIRHPEHLLRAALMGADVATMPYAVFQKVIQHPLTDKGIATFLKDWEKARK